MQQHCFSRAEVPRIRPLILVLRAVGYGDVVMTSVLGKAAVLAMILVGVVLIPVQTSQLYSQLTARRVTLGEPASFQHIVSMPDAWPGLSLLSFLHSVRQPVILDA